MARRHLLTGFPSYLRWVSIRIVKDRERDFDREREGDDPTEPEVPPEEEPLTAPEPGTLPLEPDLTPPDE
jgi:hypothetical protein